MAAEGQSSEALCEVSDALRLVFASHSLAFCSAAKRAASTGIPSITIIVESSCKQTREKCLGRLSLARPVRQTTISVAALLTPPRAAFAPCQRGVPRGDRPAQTLAVPRGKRQARSNTLAKDVALEFGKHDRQTSHRKNAVIGAVPYDNIP